MKKIIGLTGLSCAGKNRVQGILEALGLPVLDVDSLGHEALRREKDAVAARFGMRILDAAGNVDRKALGALVFGDPAALADLEAIVHPAANRLTDEWIKSREGPCVINAALLHRSSAFGKTDAIILVEAWLPVRLFRARRRDRLPWKTILERFRSQSGFISQYLSKSADIQRVYNNPFGPALETQVERTVSRLGLIQP